MTDTLVMLWVQLLLVFGTALIARKLFRQTSYRIACLQVGILVGLMLIVVAPLKPEFSGQTAPAMWAPDAVMHWSVTGPETYTYPKRQTPIKDLRELPKPIPANLPMEWIPLLWFSGAALFGIYTAWGWFQLALAGRRSIPLGVPESEIPVRRSYLIDQPFVAGAFKPHLYLPRDWSSRWTDQEFNAILKHEHAHVRFGDLHTLWVLRLLQILAWPVPTVWVLGRALAIESEKRCDEAVLLQGVQPEVYAHCLINLAERLSTQEGQGRIVSGIGAIGNPSVLEVRVRQIMSFSSDALRRVTMRGWVMMIAGGCLTLGALSIQFGKSHHQLPILQNEVFIQGPITLAVKDTNQKLLPIEEIQNGHYQMEVFSEKYPHGKVVDLWPKANPIRIALTDWRKVYALKILGKQPGFGLTSHELYLGANPNCSLMLSKPTKLTGTVALPDGLPAKGVRMVVSMISGSSQYSADDFSSLTQTGNDRLLLSDVCDEQGRFEISDIPMNSAVNVEPMDNRFLVSKGFHLGANSTISSEGFVMDQDSKDAGQIHLQYSALITGKVTGSNGEPQVGFGVKAMGVSGTGYSRTDQEGKFQIANILPGKYTVGVEIPNEFQSKLSTRAVNNVVAQAGKSATVDFVCKPGASIFGTVYHQDGRPVPETILCVYSESEYWFQYVRTDSNGKYEINVSPGYRRIFLLLSEHNPKAIDKHEIEFKEGQRIKIDWPVD